MSSSLLSVQRKYIPEIAVVVTALVSGILMSAYLYQKHLILVLTDSYAHLNFSKMFFQSMTPGISQIGFWPPLLHILTSPFAMIPSLYKSGLASAVVLIPFLALGSFFLYKLSFLFTKNAWLSMLSALIFILNPYVLYYSSVPMMEILFLANLFGTAYFTALWLKYDRFLYLFGAALFVTLTTLSRFEGLILLPLLLLIIVVNLIRKKTSYSKAQSLIILFLFVAVLGALTIFVYSWIFGGSPLAFTGKNWIAEPAFGFPTSHNLFYAGYYLLHASFYMMYQPLVLFSFLSLFAILLLSHEKFELFSVFAILFSPVAFIVAALYTGSFQLAVPDLPPGKIFLNERYGLTWIGFVILAPTVSLGYLINRARDNRFLRYLSFGTSAVAAMLLVYLSASNFYDVAVVSDYFVIRDNINSPRAQQIQVGDYLQSNYDFGKILITRNDNDPVLTISGLPLSDYISEGNYLYYDQTNQEPWMFARFVVMHNPTDPFPKSIEASDKIASEWANSAQFNYYYQLVMQNSKRRVYKVRSDRVQQMAMQQHLDLSQIPSINKSIVWWDPSNIYAKIQNKTAVGLR